MLVKDYFISFTTNTEKKVCGLAKVIFNFVSEFKITFNPFYSIDKTNRDFKLSMEKIAREYQKSVNDSIENKIWLKEIEYQVECISWRMVKESNKDFILDPTFQ
jgi:hypothetical protein